MDNQGALTPLGAGDDVGDGLPQRPTGSSLGHIEARFLLPGTKDKMSDLPEAIRLAACFIPLRETEVRAGS